MKLGIFLSLVSFETTMIASANVFAAEEGHGIAGHKHLALFVGTGKEETPTEKHDAVAVGFEFEYRINDDWGIGAIVEALDVHHRGNLVLVAPISYHFGGGFRVFAGPGIELKQKARDDRGLFRLGIGYEFHVNEKWTIAPEAIYDFLGGHGDTWLVGVAIGYGF